MELKLDVIIFNHFFYTKKSTLSYQELDDIINFLKKESNYAITVECDRDTLLAVSSHYCELFILKPTYIEITPYMDHPQNNPKIDYIQFYKEVYDDFKLPEYVKELFSNYFSNVYIK